MRLLRPALLLASVAGALTATTPAQAAISWTACTPAGFQCGELAVPVDRTGAVPGTITLEAKRAVASANPTRTAVVALAGGPGQAALPISSAFASDLAAGLADRDLLVFDQRGTGTSSRLRCPALERSSGTLTSAISACARQIGPARGSFRTVDSVADLEALRVGGGYEKLVLYGVSYGTKVAEGYAAAHPDRTAGLILDSVVTPDGPDALRRETFGALGRVLGELCAGTNCRGITTDVRGDLTKVASLLRRRALTASVYDRRGQASRARLTESGLLSILLAGDLNPQLRAELPGSLRAALGGDPRPLVRLSANASGLDNSRNQSAVGKDSDALYVATVCEDAAGLPWQRGASLSAKRAQAQAAVRALPAGTTGPFSRSLALGGVPSICLGYDPVSPAPVATGPLPAVPTLILDGQADLRTPLENAQAVGAAIPGAGVVAVPFTGHSVLGSDFSSCAKDAVTKFFAGQPQTPCAPSANRFPPTPKAPRTFAALRPFGSVPGVRGRTLQALRLTVNDGIQQLLGAALTSGGEPVGVGGLRGGAVRAAGSTYRFASYEYVPGVLVSGTYNRRGTSTFTIRGRGTAAGRVSVARSGAVSGRLGGRKVTVKFAGAASAGGPRLTVEQAAARGRQARRAG